MAVSLSRKQTGAVLSIGLNAFLIALKLSVAIYAGSLGVLASSVDSLIDLVISILMLAAVSIADAPPDEGHPFGHGKFEDFAGLIEALLIILGAVFIAIEAVPRLLHPAHHALQPVWALGVMVLALALDFVLSKWLGKLARETDSSALMVESQHLKGDMLSALAVIVGLALVKVTGMPIFDALVALVVAIMILAMGLKVIRQVFGHLTDTALPADEEAHIREWIYQAFPPDVTVKLDDLRTSRAGSTRRIVFNLLVPPQMTVQTAHDYCDHIEDKLQAELPQSLVTIHVEPLPS